VWNFDVSKCTGSKTAVLPPTGKTFPLSVAIRPVGPVSCASSCSSSSRILSLFPSLFSSLLYPLSPPYPHLYLLSSYLSSILMPLSSLLVV